jgi:hypothetical protein
MVVRFPDLRNEGMTMGTLNLDYTKDVETILTVSVDLRMTLEVFGDPNNASYEWRLRRENGQVEQHSNAGYGSVSIALRDGLCAYHGLPDPDFRVIVS